MHLLKFEDWQRQSRQKLTESTTDTRLYSEVLRNWLKDYINWNTEDGTEKPAYPKASEASVREFFENNHEDECNEENIKNILEMLQRKENPTNIWDKYGDNLPSYFLSTYYDYPTDEQIREFEKFPELTGEDIYQGVGYTIIGKGIKNKEKFRMMISVIELMMDRFYPNDQRFKDALAILQKDNTHA